MLKCCCTSRSRSSITAVMHDQLHWLDISSRIKFKLCVVVRRCSDGSAPSYLRRLLTPVSSLPSRSHLRSSTAGDLTVPRFSCSTFGPQAFAISAPCAWNSLPSSLKCANCSLPTFRKKLKTHFFANMNSWFFFFCQLFILYLGIFDFCWTLLLARALGLFL